MIGSLTFISNVSYNPIISVAYAEIQTYEGTGEYEMSLYDDIRVAKMRARQRAEQIAKDRAGVYVRSYYRSEKSQLVEKEISAITNNITKIIDVKYEQREKVNHDGTKVITWIVDLKANIDTDGIQDYLDRDELEKLNLVNRNEELQKLKIENDNKIAELEHKIINAKTDDERLQIKREIKQNEREFLAICKLEEGFYLFQQINAYGAIEKYNEAMALDPNMEEVYIFRGLAYSMLLNYRQALADSNKYIELNLDFPEGYYVRGMAYFGLKDYKNALIDINKTIELNPKSLKADAYATRGMICLILKNYKKSLSDYNKALELESNNEFIYANRGLALVRLENYQQAMEDCNKAIELNPKCTVAYVNRSFVYLLGLKQYEQAMEDCNKAITLNPNLQWLIWLVDYFMKNSKITNRQFQITIKQLNYM